MPAAGKAVTTTTLRSILSLGIFFSCGANDPGQKWFGSLESSKEKESQAPGDGGLRDERLTQRLHVDDRRVLELVEVSPLQLQRQAQKIA